MFEIAAAKQEDEPFLYDLYASTRQDEVSSWGWEPAEADQFLKMQFRFQQRSYSMQYPKAECRILRQHQKRIGRMLIAHQPDAMVLVDFSLLAEFRGKGIGTAVLTTLQQESRLCQKPIHLQVLKSNPAKRLYQRLGFEVVHESELYEQMEWYH